MDDGTQHAHKLVQIFIVVEVVDACSYLQNKHSKCGIGEYIGVDEQSKASGETKPMPNSTQHGRNYLKTNTSGQTPPPEISAHLTSKMIPYIEDTLSG